MKSESVWQRGNDCTGFVSDAVFDSALSYETYTVIIHSDSEADNREGTVIRMAVRFDEGGVVTFSDGNRIIRQVYQYTDKAAGAFREMVDSSIAEYRERGLELEFDVDMGKIPIKFTNLETESSSN